MLGRSGCGKTSFFLGLLYQQIQRGGGYIFIDGKVSRKTIDQVYYLSKLAMRESLFRIFNPSDPMITHTYNPLIKAVQNIEKSNVAETLIKLLDPIPEGSLAQHYQTLTLNLLHRVVKVFHTIGKAATIRDLLEVLSHLDVVYPILAEEIKDAHMMRDLVEYHNIFRRKSSKPGKKNSRASTQRSTPFSHPRRPGPCVRQDRTSISTMSFTRARTSTSACPWTETRRSPRVWEG